MPLDDPQNPVRFRTEAFWQWHFANAHEAGGRIVVDLCRYDDFSSFEQLGDGQHFEPGVLSRVVIDPSTKTLETTRLWATGCEFPRVHPRLEGQPNRYTWLTTPREDARGDGGIARFDHKTRQTRHLQFEAHQIASEAVFVPRPDGTTEDDGWAICWVYDAREHATFAAVLDGRAPEQGPIAKAWFDHHIPVTFHGNWLAG